MKKILALLLFILCFCATGHATPAFYRTVTIPHTFFVNNDQSNYPVLVCANDSTGNCTTSVANLNQSGGGAHVQSASGFDIRPYTNTDCSTGPLSFQLVSYTAASGQFEMWILFSTVSHTTDTVFYLCYDDSSLTTDGTDNATVWANYQDVYHLNDASDSGTSGLIFNASSTCTPTAGLISGGSACNDGMKHGWVSSITSTLSLTTGSITFTLIPDWSSGDSNDHLFFGFGSSGNPFLRCQKFVDNNIYCGWAGTFGVPDNRVVVADTGLFTSGVAAQWKLTWDSAGNTILYKNGSSVGSHSTGTPSGPDNTRMCLASTAFNTTDDCTATITDTGIFDEFRMTSSVDNSDIAADDWNVINNQTSITFGAETSVGSSGNCVSTVCTIKVLDPIASN